MKMQTIRKHIIIIISIFIGPAIAAAGIIGIDKALYSVRDVPIELSLQTAELDALETYFGHIEDAACPPETTVTEDILFERMINDVRNKLHGYPAELVSLEHTGDSSEHGDWYAIIEISDWMTGGTDTDCYQAMKLFHEICKINGMVLEVRGDFVPSSVNPMTIEWTGYVLELAGYDEYPPKAVKITNSDI